MVRTVVGDEAQVEARVDSLFLSRRPVQVGLLIGKLGVAALRDSVFALIPTPAKDGAEAAKIVGAAGSQKEGGGKKGATKAKPAVDSSSVVVDTDWVAEHARQVSRMLVGGMDVVGVFVFATEVAFKNSSAILWQAVRAVATASPVRGHSNETHERLLLHISSSPRRVSCRSCALDASFSSTGLRPCEWKLGKLFPSLHTFVCSHPVDIRLPVLAKETEASSMTVKDNFLAAIAAEAARLKSAVALVDGVVPSRDKVLGAASTLDRPQEVELLSSLDGSRGAGDMEGRQKMAAMVTLSGVVHARAYASPREPLQRAILDLKEDIIASLRARLDLLCDEAEQAVEDAQLRDDREQERSASLKADALSPFVRPSGDESAECSLLLPRRVYVPWHGGALFCDYLLHDETLQDVKDRCTELFAVNEDMDASQILQPESSAAAPPGTSFSAAVTQEGSNNPGRVPGAAGKRDNESSTIEAKLSSKVPAPPRAMAIFGALFSLFFAIIVALLMTR